MPLPEHLFKKIKCCLSNDNHIVHEPIYFKCDFNACKKCIIDSKLETLKCFGCNGTHPKADYLNAPVNTVAEFLVKTNLKDLFDDLNKKIEFFTGLIR